MSGGDTAFMALLEFLRKTYDTNEAEAARLLGMKHPDVLHYKKNPMRWPSTWRRRLATLYRLGEKSGRHKATCKLLEAVKRVHGVTAQKEIARLFGIGHAAVAHWHTGRSNPTPRQIERMLKHGANLRVKPLIEFYPVQPQKLRKCWHITAKKEDRDRVRRVLEGMRGLYIFYDSMGYAIYVGQTSKDLLFETEQRLRQTTRQQFFGYRLRRNKLCLGNVARYVSAYSIEGTGVVTKLEALLIRAMANNLQNHHMERL